METAGGPVWAEADEGGLHIVLRNLLSNAIKYTGEGGEVWVRVRADEALAVLEVEDTGIGMDPDTTAELRSLQVRLRTACAIVQSMCSTLKGGVFAQQEHLRRSELDSEPINRTDGLQLSDGWAPDQVWSDDDSHFWRLETGTHVNHIYHNACSEGVGREYEGTGLGLTLVKKLLDRMGGSIEIETEKGVGACFTARLPRAEEGPESA